MVSNINKALMNYIDEPLLHTKKILIKFLWAEIIDALKGCPGCTKFERKYTFCYKNNMNKENSLPDEVKLFGIKKDFNGALEELIKDFIKKITNHKKNSETILALAGDKIVLQQDWQE